MIVIATINCNTCLLQCCSVAVPKIDITNIKINSIFIYINIDKNVGMEKAFRELQHCNKCNEQKC